MLPPSIRQCPSHVLIIHHVSPSVTLYYFLALSLSRFTFPLMRSLWSHTFSVTTPLWFHSVRHYSLFLPHDTLRPFSFSAIALLVSCSIRGSWFFTLNWLWPPPTPPPGWPLPRSSNVQNWFETHCYRLSDNNSFQYIYIYIYI